MLKHENSDWREKLAAQAAAHGFPVLAQSKSAQMAPALKSPGIMKQMTTSESKGGKPGMF